MQLALNKDSRLVKQPKPLTGYRQRNNVIRFPVIRKVNSECIGFSANSHCSWVVLPKARKAIMFDMQGLSDRGSPVFKNRNLENRAVESRKERFFGKHRTLRQVPKIKSCKNQNCCPYQRIQQRNAKSKEARLEKETKKTKECQCCNCLGPEEQFPVSPGSISKPKLSTITVECQSKRKHSDMSAEKVDGDGCQEVNPSALELSVKKSFPMAKIDRFFFFLFFSAWVTVGIRNLVEAFSDVSRPPGIGF